MVFGPSTSKSISLMMISFDKVCSAHVQTVQIILEPFSINENISPRYFATTTLF